MKTVMPFDNTTRTLLRRYTTDPPPSVAYWYGVWNTILTALFPSSQGYVITPQLGVAEDLKTHIPDFVTEVAKMSESTPGRSLVLRTVLVVKIRNTLHWDSDKGKDSLMRHIRIQTDAAFADTEVGKVYWIGVIGPHWRYGETEKGYGGQDPRPLIAWHNVTQSDASYDDLMRLADLVAIM